MEVEALESASIVTALRKPFFGFRQSVRERRHSVVQGKVADAAIAMALATMLFAALYKVPPDAEMRWKDLWLGAFVTAILLVAGKFLIGWYLQSGSIGASWGSAAASVIVILVWVYYASLIVLFGAELTQAWVARVGGGIRPSKGAVRVIEKKVHVRPGEGKPAQAGG